MSTEAAPLDIRLTAVDGKLQRSSVTCMLDVDLPLQPLVFYIRQLEGTTSGAP
jgi:hypothetical protein